MYFFESYFEFLCTVLIPDAVVTAKATAEWENHDSVKNPLAVISSRVSYDLTDIDYF